MNSVTIKYEADQEHQLAAVASVVGLFEGLSRYDTSPGRQLEDFVPNLPAWYTLEATWLLDNLQAVQRAGGLPESMSVSQDSGFMVEGVSSDTWEYPSFTVEMETGTGKTYVYLRIIHELRRRYGFGKFIIVVPSVAIWEGVVGALKDTREHFKGLYGNENVTPLPYDGNVQDLKNFATSEFVEILVMTVDSFNRKSNKVFKKPDNLPGNLLPYQYLQETRPILILDESQNYCSPKSQAALRTLKPLFAINFSATPGREAPNVLHKLTPFKAFEKGLVKKIEVLGLVEAQSTASRNDWLKLVSIDSRLNALFRLMAMVDGALVETEFSLGSRADLAAKTSNPAYSGWVIEEINRAEGFVAFANGERCDLEDERNAALTREALFKRQIEETILVHFSKQRELRDQGVKVLTLFFVDRVSSYRGEDAVIRRLFDEAFERLKAGDSWYSRYSAAQVREGYFAKKKVSAADTEVDTAFEEDNKTEDDKKAEKAAYDLIMKRKGQLLSFEEPVSFIFAHSALREGWDNPNVFQICALREITSEKARRQTIGRGLRLPVTQDGKRIMDRRLNLLTVVANDSYANYVARLQKEYVDSGDQAPEQPADYRAKATARRNERIYNSLDFKNFWHKLVRRTEYRILIETEALVTDTIARLENASYPVPHIVITKGVYVISDWRIDLLEADGIVARIRIQRKSSDGGNAESTHDVKKGSDLAKALKEPVLKPFKVTEVKGSGDSASVEFSEGGMLSRDKPIIFSTEKGQSCSTRKVAEEPGLLPKPNLIERASEELSLTRSTILAIWKGLGDGRKKQFVSNPEGFASVFIGTIREALADHITDRLVYVPKEDVDQRDIEKVFPPSKEYPAKELVAGHGDRSLYDLVQKDSDNEVAFIHQLNDGVDDKTILYFKFPTTFKIGIPRLIGNYNPDWGILRWNQRHLLKMELVRETKGTENMDRLQHPDEKRKIECARKHFAALGMSYRPVKGDNPYWWEEEDRTRPAELPLR